MKHSRRYFLGAISTLSILPLSMSNATNVHKAAILLYSRSGNTATLADFIREQIQAPIFRISPKVPYNADYSKMTDGARAEVRNGAYRELASPLPDLSNYDTKKFGCLGGRSWEPNPPSSNFSFFTELHFYHSFRTCIFSKKLSPADRNACPT